MHSVADIQEISRIAYGFIAPVKLTWSGELLPILATIFAFRSIGNCIREMNQTDRPKWSDVKRELQALDRDTLIGLVGDLYKFSAGTLDLMLTYVETGTRFTNDSRAMRDVCAMTRAMTHSRSAMIVSGKSCIAHLGNLGSLGNLARR